MRSAAYAAAGLGREHDEVVVGDEPSRWTQSVTIECRTNVAPVGERERRGTVPRLHQRGVMLVERAPIRLHRRIVLPRLWHEHRHRVRERPPRVYEQLDDVIQRRRVALVGLHDGENIGERVTEARRCHLLFANPHPGEVAADRVDLAVVAEKPIRVRARPRRNRVGGEPGVNDRQSSCRRGRCQIRIKGAELIGAQQALVDDCARRKTRDVHLGRGPLERTTKHVESTLERRAIIGLAVERDRRDKELPDARTRAPRVAAEQRRVGRHVTPSQHAASAGGDASLDAALGGEPFFPRAREKQHADAILARFGQRDVEATADTAEVRVRQLQEQA